MFRPITTHLYLFLLLLKLTNQTHIEFHDRPGEHPPDAHIMQKFRWLSGGECCVPVDLILAGGVEEKFRPVRVVFEYFARSALFVFAYADDQPACLGPSVDGYKDPSAQLLVKDFIARPHQKWSGAMFTLDGPGPVLTSHRNETQRDAVTTNHIGKIVFPWTITYEGVIHYQEEPDSLEYVDSRRRSHIRGVPQFTPSQVGSVADS
ncbi:MAG: hypothetical protein Q9179_000347 [Wetmoreana sp. 5 TL-2023]